MDGVEAGDRGSVDGTVNVTVGSVELVGVTEDSVGLDTLEKLGSEGKTTGEAGGDGPGIDGEEGVDRPGGMGVGKLGTCSPIPGGGKGDKSLDGVTLETVDGGSGIFSGRIYSSSTVSTSELGIVGMLETLGTGLLAQ